MRDNSILRSLARALAATALFAPARRTWEQNRRQWTLPLTKWQKLWTGGYLILSDYAAGLFPPTFTDQQKAYAGEIDYKFSLPGCDPAEITAAQMRKPFWSAASVRQYLHGFQRLTAVFEQLGIRPPQTLLELGCGPGWMAEFLAQMGYAVTATTISPPEVEDARRRIASLQAKQIPFQLAFRVGAMESIDEAVKDLLPFDAVFAFEALHHAYDWRRSLAAAHACLKPGGWLVLANEPNVLHTCVSYRVAKLSNTHEIGFSRRDLVRGLRAAGFDEIRILPPRCTGFIRDHWIAARRRA